MKAKIISASVTRPGNTDQYTAGEVFAASTPVSLKFRGLPSYNDNKSGWILNNAIVISNANQATKPDLELWLFSADVTVPADNAAFAPTDAEMETLVGVITIPLASFKIGLSGSGASGNIAQTLVNLGIAGQYSALYGVLVVRNTYTPISEEKFSIGLGFIQEHTGRGAY